MRANTHGTDVWETEKVVLLVGLDNRERYELQSVEHEEGIKEILDCWFGVLVCISFLQFC